MSALSSYLAKNYLTASGPSDQSDRPKKRRKKEKAAASSLIIADDDDLLLSSSAVIKRSVEADEDGIPTMYDGQQKSAEFRKKKQSGWKILSQPTNADAATGATDAGADDEANRILVSAAADQDSRRQELETEDAPAVVSDNDHGNAAPRMGTGVKAGLQTADDTQRLLEIEARQRRKEEKEARIARKNEPEEETIYRDATGRRIDVSLRRAEMRKQQEEAEKAKRKEREDAMGEVQMKQREERKEELEEAKFLTLGRGEDDEEMNDRLKEQDRWDDPMLAYMQQKRAEEGRAKGVGDVSTKEKTKGVGPVAKAKGKKYQGHAPPNRYGIPPGWRWDGVDRGNSFEKEWFQARSRSSRNAQLDYQWQMDE